MSDENQMEDGQLAADEIAAPYSYLHQVERLPGEGRVVKLTPTEEERAAIAELLGVDGLTEFSAKLTLKPFAGGEMVRITGSLSAHVLQTCGITLEPVEADISEKIERVFAFTVPDQDDKADMDLDAEGTEPPDPITDGHVDLGDVVVEHLALGINPFPRAEGAEFSAPKGVDDKAATSPFAVLASLKAGKSENS